MLIYLTRERLDPVVLRQRIGKFADTTVHTYPYRAFSHDVTAAIVVFQNKGTAAMMVYQTNPPGTGAHLERATSIQRL